MGFDSNPLGTVRLRNKDIGCGYSNGGGQKNSTYRTWGGWDSGLGSWFKIKSGLD